MIWFVLVILAFIAYQFFCGTLSLLSARRLRKQLYAEKTRSVFATLRHNLLMEAAHGNIDIESRAFSNIYSICTLFMREMDRQVFYWAELSSALSEPNVSEKSDRVERVRSENTKGIHDELRVLKVKIELYEQFSRAVDEVVLIRSRLLRMVMWLELKLGTGRTLTQLMHDSKVAKLNKHAQKASKIKDAMAYQMDIDIVMDKARVLRAN